MPLPESKPARVVYECAMCPAQKQDVNHWWLLFIDPEKFELRIIPWNAADAAKATWAVCGVECKLKVVSSYAGAIQDRQALALLGKGRA